MSGREWACLGGNGHVWAGMGGKERKKESLLVFFFGFSSYILYFYFSIFLFIFLVFFHDKQHTCIYILFLFTLLQQQYVTLVEW